MKGLDEKIFGVILAIVIAVVLLLIALAITSGGKEQANPLLKMITDMVGLFR